MNIELKKLANGLLGNSISFKIDCDNNTLEVTSNWYTRFKYASIHVKTGKLVLMGNNYEEIFLIDIVNGKKFIN